MIRSITSPLHYYGHNTTKYIKQALLITILSALVTILPGQTPPAKEWDKSFGGSKNEEMYTIIQTADGGYLLGGDSDSPLSGDKSQGSQGLSDYWVVKTDANGIKQWDKRFGGNSKEELFSLLQTADGSYLLGGWTMSVISGDQTQESRGMRDYWIVKIDANGNKLWDKRYGGPDVDELRAMWLTNDGGFILAGESRSNIGGDKTQDSRGGLDVWVVKTDANGDFLWDARYGGTDDDRLNAIQQTPDGGYIIGSWTISPVGGEVTQVSRGASDMWIVKIDGNGIKLWDGRYGGNEHEYLYSLDQTQDGGFILGGYTKSDLSGEVTVTGKGDFDFWIVKTDGNGIKQFDKRYGGSKDDKGKSIFQTNDGGFIMGGWSESNISGDKTQDIHGWTDYWILKTDINGDKEWDLDLGAFNEERLHDTRQTNDGGYIIAGHSFSNDNGDKSEPTNGFADYWIVKLEGTGPTEVFYADADGDGFGNAAVDTLAVIAPIGFVINSADCNDSNAAVNPGVVDVCNGVDDNCDLTIDENVLSAPVVTPAGTVTACQGDEIILTTSFDPQLSYQWYKGTTPQMGAISNTFTTTKGGNFSVEVMSDINCSASSAKTTIERISKPGAIITPLGNLDICESGSVTLQANAGDGLLYQWKKGSSLIDGATNISYTATSTGNYRVIVSNAAGCTKTSSSVTIFSSCKEGSSITVFSSGELLVYPNPATNNLSVELNLSADATTQAIVQLIDLTGRVMLTPMVPVTNGYLVFDLSLDDTIVNGTYIVKVLVSDQILAKVIAVQR